MPRACSLRAKPHRQRAACASFRTRATASLMRSMPLPPCAVTHGPPRRSSGYWLRWAALLRFYAGNMSAHARPLSLTGDGLLLIFWPSDGHREVAVPLQTRSTKAFGPSVALSQDFRKFKKKSQLEAQQEKSREFAALGRRKSVIFVKWCDFW